MLFQVERRCPYIDQEKAEKKPEIQRVKAAKKRYGIKFKKKSKSGEVEVQKEVDEDELGPSVLRVGTHTFHSCPVALLLENRGLIKLIDLIRWSEDSGIPLVEGGLLRHTRFYFQMRQAVVGEHNLIEREEHERSKPGKHADKSKQISPMSRPRAAPRRRVPKR